MIPIKKPQNPPNVLVKKGKEATEKLCLQFENGEREFEFDNRIYGHKDVKDALKKAQLDKCAFCETKLPRSSGDVEHFRPKGGYKQQDSDKLQKNGYYWLAYNWDNLFFSCEYCNRIFKRNLFPLENPHERANSHNHDLDKEIPLLINPAKESPQDFIEFKAEYAFPVNKNLKGKTTIDCFGLNDDELVEDRRTSLKMLKRIFDDLQKIPITEIDFIEEIKEYLNSQKHKSQKYSAMVCANIADEFENLKSLI
jgi:uncharacterized protein (TIGR02646 family)